MSQARDSSANLVSGGAAYLAQLAWRAAPSAVIDVDHDADDVFVSFVEGTSNVSWNPTEEISVGFHRSGEDHVVTVLCLSSASAVVADGGYSWTAYPGIPGDLRQLLGDTVWGAVREAVARGAGQPPTGASPKRRIRLEQVEADGLVRAWSAAATRYGEPIED